MNAMAYELWTEEGEKVFEITDNLTLIEKLDVFVKLAFDITNARNEINNEEFKENEKNHLDKLLESCEKVYLNGKEIDFLEAIYVNNFNQGSKLIEDMKKRGYKFN